MKTVFCTNRTHYLKSHNEINTSYVFNTNFQTEAIYFLNFKTVEQFKSLLKEHLSKDPSSKLVIFHDWSPSFPKEDSDRIKKIITDIEINPTQLYFITLQYIDVPILQEYLGQDGIVGVNIEGRNHLMIDLNPIYDFNIPPKNKFSLCSRSYRPWRLNVFAKLIEHNLLDDFVYTFSHHEPALDLSHNKEDIKLEKCVVTSSRRNDIETFIDKMPYLLGENYYDIYNEEVFKAIQSSYINFVLESVIDEPIHLTEKTGKAIACKRPFIIFGVNGIYALLHKIGFKSFHPYINEEFDTIENNNLRLYMILKELKRLQSLSIQELDSLLNQLQPIIDYNYQKLLEIKDHKWSQPFKDLDIFN